MFSQALTTRPVLNNFHMQSIFVIHRFCVYEFGYLLELLYNPKINALAFSRSFGPCTKHKKF
jgi:hypothetical protein